MSRLDSLRKTLRISLAMAKTDFILRIEGNYLGIFWYLLNPLIMFLVIILIKNYAIKNTEITAYPIYLLIGLTGLNFFRLALTNSIKSIRSNIDYIKSMNHIVPETLVISGLIQAIFSHFFEFILIVIFLIYYHVSLIGILFYPIIFLFFTLFVLGVSFIFATVGMYVNDFTNIWNNVAQLLLFVTPVFYSISKMGFLYLINIINPLTYFLAVARDAIINLSPPSTLAAIIMIAICFVTLIGGWAIFNKFKNKFAEL